MAKRLMLPAFVAVLAVGVPIRPPVGGTLAAVPLGGQDEVVMSMSNPAVHPRLAIPTFVVADADAALSTAAKTVADVLWDDLDFEREYYLIPRETAAQVPAAEANALNFEKWAELAADVVIAGKVRPNGNQMMVEIRAVVTRGEHKGKELFAVGYPNCTMANARGCAHAIADDFHKRTRALDGVARTRLAFTSDRNPQRVAGRPSNTGAQSKEIYISDYDGANERRFTVNSNLNVSPAWSPTRRLLAYVSWISGVPDVYVANLQEPGRGLQRPAGGSATDQNWTPAWSPDGSKLAFVSNRSGNADVWVVNADGTGLQNLTNSPLSDNCPTWSPDGSKIAFTSDRSGRNQLYVISASGTALQRIVADRVDRPTWSSLNFIAFTLGNGPGYDIAIYDFNNPGAVRVLTDGVGSNESPAVAPNGRHIAFVTTRWGKANIAVIDRRGERIKQITRSGNDTYPNWEPIAGR